MHQLLQSLRTGETQVAEVPAPGPSRGRVLVRTSRTLISAGTERMLVEFGRAGWIEKARQQPDRVRQVLDKIRTDGLAPTLEAVLGKLDQPLPLGYCNVGVALDVGAGVVGIARGDRVVSNGAHAEVVSVPGNLCAVVPAGVSDEAAAFTVLGAIGLQGIRLAAPTLGETVVVTGLGLIGLMTVQMLRANGCRVIGVDLDPAKLALARQFGADVVDVRAGEDPVAAALALTGGRGVDAVLITAATQSSEPVRQAAQMSRKRGRIVLVGVAGLELSRADFYEKELTFQVSCSYGPGRYDPTYEERGVDYPIGFVRWTEQRNFEAVLGMMRDGQVDVRPLVSHRFAVTDAPAAYDVVTGSAPSLGILLEYPAPAARPEADVRTRTVAVRAPRAATGAVALGIVGAGNYASAILIPAFQATGARLVAVASRGGVSGAHAARKFGAERATTDVEALLADREVEAVVIATRHDTHARLACEALAAGKHVFVEKPLALTEAEVAAIEAAHQGTAASRVLMVGFNRRFSPLTAEVRRLLASVRGPRSFVMTVNAGALPATHWTQDPGEGGGRLAGEGCHFIDLLRHLAGAPVAGFDVAALGGKGSDTATITLRFADGSFGTIHYLANGHKSFPKERLEVFAGGRILQLDNWRVLRGFGWPGFRQRKLWRQDKGQAACAAAFVQAVATGAASPIPVDELLEVARVTIAVAGAVG